MDLPADAVERRRQLRGAVDALQPRRALDEGVADVAVRAQDLGVGRLEGGLDRLRGAQPAGLAAVQVMRHGSDVAARHVQVDLVGGRVVGADRVQQARSGADRAEAADHREGLENRLARLDQIRVVGLGDFQRGIAQRGQAIDRQGRAKLGRQPGLGAKREVAALDVQAVALGHQRAAVVHRASRHAAVGAQDAIGLDRDVPGHAAVQFDRAAGDGRGAGIAVLAPQDQGAGACLGQAGVAADVVEELRAHAVEVRHEIPAQRQARVEQGGAAHRARHVQPAPAEAGTVAQVVGGRQQGLAQCAVVHPGIGLRYQRCRGGDHGRGERGARQFVVVRRPRADAPVRGDTAGVGPGREIAVGQHLRDRQPAAFQRRHDTRRGGQQIGIGLRFVAVGPDQQLAIAVHGFVERREEGLDRRRIGLGFVAVGHDVLGAGNEGPGIVDDLDPARVQG